MDNMDGRLNSAILQCVFPEWYVTSQFILTMKLTTSFLDGMNNRKCLRWGEHLRVSPVL